MKENKMPTRTVGLIPAIALALGLGLCVNSARAGQPTRIPAYYNGQIDYVIPGVSTNVLGVQSTAIATRVANPIYVILPVSEENAQPIDHVLGVADPGVAGYNPYWDVIYVTVLDGRDLTNPDNQFTSEDQILLAAADPTKVKLTDTGFILLCQVVSK